MKQYAVYGLGNALVDIEYQISDALLTQLGIAKGVMTLVDADQQARIIQQLSAYEVNRGSGGSAANSIIAVNQLGGKAFYSCKVADDELGHFYINDFNQAGIAHNINLTTGGVTGKCLVFVTSDAERTMNTFLGVSAEFSPEEIDPVAIAAAEYVYIEGYLVTGESTKAAALSAGAIARANQSKIAVSLSDPNIVHFFKSELLEIIGTGVDLLFANATEALKMAATDDLATALSFLSQYTKMLVVTLGADGAVIYHQGHQYDIPGIKTTAVDTVGAGDIFAGCYLYGITHGMSIIQAGELAAKAAAKLVAHYGPRLDNASLRKLITA